MLNLASDSLNKFTMALYSKLVINKPKENTFYSPASIYVALAMTYAGTKGDTAKEIEQVMNWNKPETVHEMIHSLQESILSTSGKCSGIKLNLANRLWAQKSYTILKEYTDILQSYYKAEMGAADFVSHPAEARQTINRWIEEETNDKITDLIKDGVLTATTRLVLTNAIYFKGFWEKQFKKGNTHAGDFKVSKTKTIKIKMMNKTDRHLYGRNEELSCQVLKLSYKEKKMAMMILLPDEVDGLVKLENKLNAEYIRKCDKMMRNESVEVSLPKFKLNCQFNMTEILSQLGICDLFHADNADLSGVTGDRDLYVSHIIHQAFVDVNEEGTEAAAATGAVSNRRRLPLPPELFRADHPFLFVIQDCESGAILFLGRVVNPE